MPEEKTSYPWAMFSAPRYLEPVNCPANTLFYQTIEDNFMNPDDVFRNSNQWKWKVIRAVAQSNVSLSQVDTVDLAEVVLAGSTLEKSMSNRVLMSVFAGYIVAGLHSWLSGNPTNTYDGDVELLMLHLEDTDQPNIVQPLIMSEDGNQLRPEQAKIDSSETWCVLLNSIKTEKRDYDQD